MVLIVYSSVHLHANDKNKIIIIASTACNIRSLNLQELRKLYLGKIEYLQDQLIVVLDNEEKETYDRFLIQYLNKTPKAMKAYRMRMLFTGKKIPPEKLNVAEIKQYKDSICYLTYIKKKKIVSHWKKVNIYDN
jgi:ABC-type phosphate transport system substrate-binding protein